MKTTIAYKEKGVGIICFILVSMGVLGFVYGVQQNLFAAAIGVLLVILGFVSAVRYFLLPSQMIVLSCDGRTLILPKGVTVPVGSIMKVLYYRGEKGQIKMKWGRVTIYTYSGTYKCDFVANCKDVAEELTRLMNEAK
ncbi:MAG: hypothetical protein IJV73_04760 [Clostridia bacterium]|nr:hypothetical protein [Clostridia bacterium]